MDDEQEFVKLESGVWQRGTVFFFVDETENFVGPCPSEQDALRASKEYGEWLNGTTTHSED